MWTYIFLILLVSFLQFCYFLTSKKSKSANHKTVLQIALLTLIVLLYLVLFARSVQYHKPHPFAENSSYHFSSFRSPVDSSVAEFITSRQTGSIKNFYFIYQASDKSTSTVSDVALRLRQQYCKMYCVINLYDDVNAYTIDMERLTITSNQVMETWNKKNYIFVADHYLGYLDPVPEATFTYYPFHDWYYNQLKTAQ
jgi:hypothetical protein